MPLRFLNRNCGLHMYGSYGPRRRLSRERLGRSWKKEHLGCTRKCMRRFVDQARNAHVLPSPPAAFSLLSRPPASFSSLLVAEHCNSDTCRICRCHTPASGRLDLRVACNNRIRIDNLDFVRSIAACGCNAHVASGTGARSIQHIGTRNHVHPFQAKPPARRDSRPCRPATLSQLVSHCSKRECAPATSTRRHKTRP